MQITSFDHVAPVIMKDQGNEIIQYWEFENEPLVWGDHLGEINDLKLYRDSLELKLGKIDFLKRVQKEASQSDPYGSRDSENGDLVNAQLVHSGSAGTIRPINFLEAELLNYQLSRYPLLSHPTEFHGFILLNDSLSRVRVYFAASDKPWPPRPTAIIDSIKKDLQQGWDLKYHLHNHYEPKANSYVGILAPSMADAQFFIFLSEDFDLDYALITNGFHTVEIESKEFLKFKAHHK